MNPFYICLKSKPKSAHLPSQEEQFTLSQCTLLLHLLAFKVHAY